MQKIAIKTVEVGEKFVTIAYAKEESRQGITMPVTTKRKFPFNIHDELKVALDNLKPHFAILTESLRVLKGQNIANITGSTELEGFEVTGFESKRQGDNFGVIITGHRKLQDGRTVKFSTPFINFDVEISEYDYITELNADVDLAKQEAIEYINGKFKSEGTQVGVFDTPEDMPVKKLSTKKKPESKAA
jgi:hypothetical protein